MAQEHGRQAMTQADAKAEARAEADGTVLQLEAHVQSQANELNQCYDTMRLQQRKTGSCAAAWKSGLLTLAKVLSGSCVRHCLYLSTYIRFVGQSWRWRVGRLLVSCLSYWNV